MFFRDLYISLATSKLHVIVSRPRGHVMRLFSPALLLSASLVAFLNWKKKPILFFSFSAHHQLSQEPNISITTIQLISEYLLLSLDLFLFKELIPFQHICKWPGDVFYNLVNYCFSRQDSRDPEHTWPEGTYLNNCFSCCTQRTRKGEGGELRQIDW